MRSLKGFWTRSAIPARSTKSEGYRHPADGQHATLEICKRENVSAPCPADRGARRRRFHCLLSEVRQHLDEVFAGYPVSAARDDYVPEHRKLCARSSQISGRSG